MLLALRQFPTEDAHRSAAARLGQRSRARDQPVATADLVIAATAPRFGSVPLHRDVDFEAIARLAPVKTKSLL
jgi:predicted nucleic acid-binding protein